MTLKKALYSGVLILLPLIILFNGGLPNKNTASAAEEIPYASNFTLETLHKELPEDSTAEMIENLSFSGEVRPRDEIDIFPDIQGKIRELRVDVGDEVKPEQILALVDPSRAGMNYNYSPIRSSIHGTITAVYAALGSQIAPGQPLCQVGTLEHLEVDIYVPEGSIGILYEGMKGIVSSPVLPGLHEAMQLKRISPIVDPISRSLKAVFIPLRQSGELKAGMFVDLTLE